MNICFISPGYPGKHDKGDYAFVKQLVDAIAAEGNECYVLCPYNVFRFRMVIPIREKYKKGEGQVWVYRPWYISLSNVFSFTQRQNEKSYRRALRKAFNMLPKMPDAIYGHFWNSAIRGYEFARDNNIPLFVATGESSIGHFISPTIVPKGFKDYISGVICVSSKNRDESVEFGLTILDKCEVFPNAVNTELFHWRERMECRNKLGLPKDAFIIAFVGLFDDRKGSMRVSEAINRIGGVHSIFIGKGDKEPKCDGILFKGALPHEQIPLYLCSADCFVLPTRAEGCCNAVIEAMACGLPIISSNRSFNWDVLDNTNSIMVDPDNIDEIASAIMTVRDNPSVRKQLAEGAIQKASNLTIDKRAGKIIEFIKSRI